MAVDAEVTAVLLNVTDHATSCHSILLASLFYHRVGAAHGSDSVEVLQRSLDVLDIVRNIKDLIS